MEFTGSANQLLIAGATLLTLLWVSITQHERAGFWWFGSGLAIAADGMLETFGNPPLWLLLSTADALGPLAAYLFYRGVAAYTDRPAHRLAAVWTLAATLGWLVVFLLDRAHISPYLIMAAQIPLVLASSALLWQARKTPLGSLLAYASFVLVALIAGGVWTRETGEPRAAKAAEVEFWLTALVPITLVLVCALLERSVARTREALDESAEQMRLTATLAGLGIWKYSTRTRQVSWSGEMWDISGLGATDEPIPNAIRTELVDPDDRKQIEDKIQVTMETNQPVQFEVPLKLADGEMRFISLRAHAVQRPDGESILLGSTVDITEQRNAIEELKVYRHQLEDLVEQRTRELQNSQRQLAQAKRLASLGTLTAGLAHQVNNPVGAIQAAADFARRCEGDPDELEVLRNAAQDIEKEANRCGEIVRGMLQFASTSPNERKILPIDDVIQDLVRTLEFTASQHGAQLELVTDGPSPYVSLSRTEIEQALTNIVVNAFQSRANGVTVKISRHQEGEDVCIEIEDDGPGIRSENLEHVLEPFYTSRIGSGGTGLGLSIAHGVAQTHGGDLSISSTFGVGTRAWFKLPMAARSVIPNGDQPPASEPS